MSSNLRHRPPKHLGLICSATYICVELRNISINKNWPFLLPLSQRPHLPTTFDSTSVLPTDTFKAIGVQVLGRRPLEKLATVKCKSPATLQERLRRYKRHLDTKVRSIVELHQQILVYVGWLYWQQPLKSFRRNIHIRIRYQWRRDPTVSRTFRHPQ